VLSWSLNSARTARRQRIKEVAIAFALAGAVTVVSAFAARSAEAGYCRVDTAAGPITIACDLSAKMQGFIADVVARGFKGPVHCLSYAKTHVPNSLHFRARACDFAQHGWGRTHRVMYRVADLTAKWGLRNGCTFGDCGHVDDGPAVTRRRQRAPAPALVAAHPFPINGVVP
jgi:hypothetical protein